MNILHLFRRPNPARELALLGHEKRHRRCIERARQIREELGMPRHPALER